jgi:hypothetical protein
MKQSSLDAIRVALTAFLGQLKSTPIPMAGHWEYTRTPMGWSGAVVPKPDTFSLFPVGDDRLNRLAAEVDPVFAGDYPDYRKRVGTAMSSGQLDARMILMRLAYESLRRFGMYSIDAVQIEQLLGELATFIDRTTVRLRIFAPALNLYGPPDLPPIAFPGGVIMRPLTDQEATAFYGGNPLFQTAAVMLRFSDFVFVLDIEIPKVIGDFGEAPSDPIVAPAQELLNRCMLVLASFKDGGAIGYDGMHITPAEFTVGVAFGNSHVWGNEHVPTARYEISASEAPRLEAHAKLFEDIHPSMEMACQRLVDAARRTKPQDSVVDSIIGLESILLRELPDRHRGETRFRFALNYASLFPAPERRDAFNTARDLYDLRSAIVHGGFPGSKKKINGKEMTIHEAANHARSVLRGALGQFMPNASRPAFLVEGYWITKALGLNSI